MTSMPQGEPTNHHYVSKGYQRNFATSDRQVTVFEPRTGQLIQRRRAIRSNFTIDNFNTFYNDDGTPDAQLEHEFARVENDALRDARRINGANICPPERRAVSELLAMHLVRSPAHRRFVDRVHADDRQRAINDTVANVLANAPFDGEDEPNPTHETIGKLTSDRYDHLRDTGWMHVDAMVGQYNRIAEFFDTLNVQVVESLPSLPGFVIGDVPVVHYQPRTGKFGFDDSLAVKDAGGIVAPITRHKAVLLTTKPEPSVRAVDLAGVYRINALLIRGAHSQVACHPDDFTHCRVVIDNLAVLLRVGPSPTSYLDIITTPPTPDDAGE